MFYFIFFTLNESCRNSLMMMKIITAFPVPQCQYQEILEKLLFLTVTVILEISFFDLPNTLLFVMTLGKNGAFLIYL